MISYGNPNIFFANIGRGDVGIAPYNRTLNRVLKKMSLNCPIPGIIRQKRGICKVYNRKPLHPGNNCGMLYDVQLSSVEEELMKVSKGSRKYEDENE